MSAKSAATGNTSPQLTVRHLGLQPYEAVWARMKQFTDNRGAEAADELWLLEHEPVYTLGQAGKREHLLAPGDIPIVKSDRGGQVTYHGPGQLIVYLLIDLRRLKLGVRDLVSLIENSVVDFLAGENIVAEAKPDAPGVYVRGDKIASLGLRVRKGCSYHGVSLNVAMNLEPFSRINVCGYQGLEVTQLADLVKNVDREAVSGALVEQIAGKLGYTEINLVKGRPAGL